MIDVFSHCIVILHFLTMQILDFGRKNILYKSCPSWLPKIKELPLPPPEQTSWFESLWQNFWKNSSSGFFSSIAKFFSSETKKNTISLSSPVVTEDADICKWFEELIKFETFSIQNQLYFVVQMALLCFLLSPVVFLMQRAAQDFIASFRKIHEGSQRFIVLHLIKAAMMACMAFSPTWQNTVFQLVEPVFQNYEPIYQPSLTMLVLQATVFCAAIEVMIVCMATNISALHYALSILGMFFLSGLNFQTFHPARMLFIYGSLSTFTFIIDIYLSVRKTLVEMNVVRGIAFRCFAGLTFFVCVMECLLNWTIQFYWFWKQISLALSEQNYTPLYWSAAYFILFANLVCDEIMLSISLWKDSMPALKTVDKKDEGAIDQVIKGMAQVQQQNDIKATEEVQQQNDMTKVEQPANVN